MNPGASVNDLLQWPGGKKAYEEEPFAFFYRQLGLNLGREPWTWITDQCWTVDMERVKGDGPYIYIMHQISRITNNELLFEDVNDFVDIENNIAWVSFSCNRDQYKWNMKVDDDWADGELFGMVQALTEKYNTKKRFTYFDAGWSDFVLGYETEDALRKLRKETGLEVAWLESIEI